MAFVSMVKMRASWLTSIFLLVFSLGLPASAYSDFRLYRLKKNEEEKRIPMMFGNKDTGCHNLLKSVSVHRVIMSRFKQCQVFAEDDCDKQSILEFHWTGTSLDHLGKTQITTNITPGSKWIITGADNRDAKSWNCE